MNPQFHDEFVALCALFYSGEISEEDWALLQIHMAYCEACHGRFYEYQKLASAVIPAMAGAAAAELNDLPPLESTSSVDAAERSLMSQLDAVSTRQKKPRPFPKQPVRWLSAALIAACGLGVAYLAGLHSVRKGNAPTAQTLEGRPAQKHLDGRAASPPTEMQQANASSQVEVTRLRAQLTAADAQVKETRLSLDGLESQLKAEQGVREQIRKDKESLDQQLAAAQVEVESLSSRVAAAEASEAQRAVKMATFENKVHELNAAIEEKDTALSEKDRMLAADKDFLDHDRDIRDLMGARNLYIADIFDTNESGRTAKQFGRIFYTKDRSLIFYGFDLDKQAGLKQDASFQVWGTGSDQPAVSLGLFYQDDNHKRWVLRYTDPTILARLDMVFVTVEPPGGSSRPTGKQLLRAYLQIPSNHP